MANVNKFVGEKNKKKYSLSLSEPDRLRFDTMVRRCTVLGIISKEEHAANHALKLNKMGFHVVLLGGTYVTIPPIIDVVIMRPASCSHNASDAAYEFSRNGGKLIVENGLSGIIRSLAGLNIHAYVPYPVKLDSEDLEILSDYEVCQELMRLIGFLHIKMVPDTKGHMLVQQAEAHLMKASSHAGLDAFTNFSALFNLLRESGAQSVAKLMQARSHAALMIDVMLDRIRNIHPAKLLNIFSELSEEYGKHEGVLIYKVSKAAQKANPNIMKKEINPQLDGFIVSSLVAATTLLRASMTKEYEANLAVAVDNAFSNSAHPVINAALKSSDVKPAVKPAVKPDVKPAVKPAVTQAEVAVVQKPELEQNKQEVEPSMPVMPVMPVMPAVTPVITPVITPAITPNITPDVSEDATMLTNEFDNFNAALQLLKTEMQVLGITMLKLNGPDLTEVTYSRTIKTSGTLSF